ncbi:GAF domain-containing sensor histidine kinase [Planomonospora sp. ID91781]|uniref:GAF domain-containing sensor histidine kinase n=1 Tax=Planomonospora sp. ID91781 TaxID=2738135 RepID=UPI0018C41619|nr:GAF domain-containing sensor histidine kinase [Planomonospora sp. ID91781]MBG0823602.1 GAF domain-containing sensor histidine kinase [Planomonospora sp. ID91781]
MTSWPRPDDEAERVRELEELHALDAVPEPQFSSIATLAAHVCGTPIGLVNLVGHDTQYLKGRHGITWTEMDRRDSFCQYTICGDRIMEIPDAQADPRFHDNSVVVGEPYVRFYAGAPVVSGHGHALGTVCVADTRPRLLSDDQRQALTTLAGNTAGLLQLHHHALRSEQMLARMREVEELKNQFLRTVNHELRTPLTAISSYLQIICDGDLDEATEQRFLRVIKRNSDRLRDLLDELLLMASLNAGTAAFAPDQADLAALVHRTVAALAERVRTGQLTMTVHAPRAVMACADAGRVQHALTQLLDNAIKFTPPGGRIEVAAWSDPAPTVEVCDTGIGIGAADIEHVFDDFYRAPEAEERAIGGTGIGLSITRKIVELHDGTVQIDSRPDKGTRVRLILPAPLPCG